MQQTIQRITQKLIDQLPENDQYYRLDELREWGFPSYIVQRIRIELERNLAESMMIPKTDWANTQSDPVLDAWQQFVDAIRAEARLPASYGKTVIETAVEDVVEMLVQPCTTIPDVIFGSDDTLPVEKVSKRLHSVVVYRHFAKFIMRYMQKKELDELSKSRCKKIIRTADQKLTRRYSPLNWAQMLDTLFKLLDGNIDSELLRLFYEDKNRPREARHFDMMNQELSRASFIEELSSPDLLNFEGYEDEQSTLFESQPDEDTVDKSSKVEEDIAEKESEKKQQNQDIPNKTEGEKEETKADPQPAGEEGTEDSNIASDFAKQTGEKGDADIVEYDEEEKADTGTENSASDESKKQKIRALNDAFAGQINDDDEVNSAKKIETADDNASAEKSADPDREREAADEELDSPGTKATKSQEVGNEPGDEDSVSPDKESKEAVEQQPEENTEPVEGIDNEEADSNPQEGDATDSETNSQQKSEVEEGENPMWMRYMSDEEAEEYREDQEGEDDGFIEDPIIDLTNESASDIEVEGLAELLEGDRELFVEEIFGGSDRAFDMAVEDIAAYSSWSDASEYIRKDIFKRNLVDVYSEAAVDFTDQLQSYFLEKENRN